MPFPMQGPRITPGPNAFAQRLSLQGGSALDPQTAQALANATPRPGSPEAQIYSPSVYLPTQRDSNASEGQYGRKAHQTTPQSGSSGKSSSTNVDHNKALPPNPASRFIENLQDTPSPTPAPHNVYAWHSSAAQTSGSLPDRRWLQPIPESNTTWRAPSGHSRTKTPPRIDMKLTKVDDTGERPKLRTVSSEAQVGSKSSQTKTTPGRRFMERIRAFPVKPSPVNYDTMRKASQESVVAAPREYLAPKAARFLGTNPSKLPEHAQYHTTARRPSVTLPSFGELDLPQPTPPFASNDLAVQKKRDGHGSSTKSNHYSPRMMREDSDPRLLLLNDRIASNTSEHASSNGSGERKSAREQPKQEHEDNMFPEPPASPLRHERRRIGGEPPARPVFGLRTPEESMASLPSQHQADVRFREGLGRNAYHVADAQNTNSVCGSFHVARADTQNTLSISGSLRGSSSDDTGLRSRYADTITEEDDVTPTAEYTPEIHWPVAWTNPAQGAYPQISPDPSQFSHASLAPSPLHIKPAISRSVPRDDSVQAAFRLFERPEDNYANAHENELFEKPQVERHATRHHPVPQEIPDREQQTTPTPERRARQRGAEALQSPPEMQTHTSATPTASFTDTPRHAVMGANQPWRSRTNTPTGPFPPDSHTLKEILSSCNSAKKEIFGLKGDLTRNDNGNMMRFSALEKKLDDVHKDVQSLHHEIASLREILSRTPTIPTTTPPLTSSSGSYADSRGSPRRSRHGPPPTSFPTNLVTIPDASPAATKTTHTSPTRSHSKHERKISESSTDYTLPSTTYVSPRAKHSKHRRGRSTSKNSIEFSPSKDRSSVVSVIHNTPTKTVRTPSSASNASSVRNASGVRSAIRNIERKASDSSNNRVATADEVFSRTPRTRTSNGSTPGSRSTSPSKSLASKAMAGMRRALSPTRGSSPSRYHTPSSSVNTTRVFDGQTRNSPQAQDPPGVGAEDLADFGIGRQAPTLYGRRGYSSDNHRVPGVRTSRDRENRQWGTR